jgi:hypothetical protein
MVYSGCTDVHSDRILTFAEARTPVKFVLAITRPYLTCGLFLRLSRLLRHHCWTPQGLSYSKKLSTTIIVGGVSHVNEVWMWVVTYIVLLSLVTAHYVACKWLYRHDVDHRRASECYLLACTHTPPSTAPTTFINGLQVLSAARSATRARVPKISRKSFYGSSSTWR